MATFAWLRSSSMIMDGQGLLAVTAAPVIAAAPLAYFLRHDHIWPAVATILTFQSALVFVNRALLSTSKERPKPFNPYISSKIFQVLVLWTVFVVEDFLVLGLGRSLLLLIVCLVPMVHDIFLAASSLVSDGYRWHYHENQYQFLLKTLGLVLLCLTKNQVLFEDPHTLGIGAITCLFVSVIWVDSEAVMEYGQLENEEVTEETAEEITAPTTHTKEEFSEDSASHEEEEEARNGVGDVVTKSTKKRRDSGNISIESGEPLVDKVFTVGCFDLFHRGHIRLLKRMKGYGRQLIVGVHDSRSIYKLKDRVPVDSLEVRMANVRPHADMVYAIPACDPSPYMAGVMQLMEGETGLYIRGDDMINFPGRPVVEACMPIKFLSYTTGVSSTQIRKENYAHIKPHDMVHLNAIDELSSLI